MSALIRGMQGIRFDEFLEAGSFLRVRVRDGKRASGGAALRVAGCGGASELICVRGNSGMRGPAQGVRKKA